MGNRVEKVDGFDFEEIVYTEEIIKQNITILNVLFGDSC